MGSSGGCISGATGSGGSSDGISSAGGSIGSGSGTTTGSATGSSTGSTMGSAVSRSLPFPLELSAASEVVLTLDHRFEALQRLRELISPLEELGSFEVDPKILLRNVERRDWGSMMVEGPASGFASGTVSLRFGLEGNWPMAVK